MNGVIQDGLEQQRRIAKTPGNPARSVQGPRSCRPPSPRGHRVLGVGGAESHLIRTLPRLVEYGWSIATFCVSERGERAEQVEAAGVEVFAASARLARRKGLVSADTRRMSALLATSSIG